jgi:hypothetical protein
MQVSTNIDFIEKSAIFSDDKIYRYTLSRKWSGGNGKFVVWIMLNPSTADDQLEDPTIRRCCLYAKDWGYSGIIILNIFAFRDTDPSKMKKFHSPIGKDNDRYILEVVNNDDVGLIIGGWGQHGSHLNRNGHVKKLLSHKTIHCLGKTKCGNPLHPLYLRKDLLPKIL